MAGSRCALSNLVLYLSKALGRSAIILTCGDSLWSKAALAVSTMASEVALRRSHSPLSPSMKVFSLSDSRPDLSLASRKSMLSAFSDTSFSTASTW